LTRVNKRLPRALAIASLAAGALLVVVLAIRGRVGPPRARRGVPRLAVTRFLAFGDSMTEGLVEVRPAADALERLDYPSQLASMLTATFAGQPIEVINAGRGGERATEGLARLPRLLAREHPDVLLLMEGTNDLVDYQHGVSVSIDALTKMVDMAHASHIRTLVATLPPQRVGARRAWAGQMVPVFNARLRRVAIEKGWRLVNVDFAFDNLTTLLGSDGLHPTAAGYHRIAQTFFDAIKASFEVKSAEGAP
jgi:lysophospholipase L1-like esterase